MRSSWSLGIVFIALGGIAVSPLGARHVLTPAALVVAGLLVVGGIALMTRRAFAFWVAIAAAAVAAATGVAALLGRPQLALPVSPVLSIVVGLYLILRTFMMRASLGKPPRGFLPRDDSPDEPRPE
jgi:hypothetical protein